MLHELFVIESADEQNALAWRWAKIRYRPPQSTATCFRRLQERLRVFRPMDEFEGRDVG
jgi:hypothetical protein